MTQLPRRALLSLVAAAPLVPLLPRAVLAAAPGPDTSVRALGNPKAPRTVTEFFSLTCTHCSHFAGTTFPEVKEKLIKTGKLYYIFSDFPLDRLALRAAMVARTLPADRYDPFVETLLANQDRWAFARGINYNDELFKYAALAGMSRPDFDKAIADKALQDFILSEQQKAEKIYKVDSTPSFLVDGTIHAGDMDYNGFAAMIASPATKT